VVAGEDSQWELAPGIGVTLAVMHDYSYHNDDIPRNDLMMLKLDSILQILGSSEAQFLQIFTFSLRFLIIIWSTPK